MKEANREDRQVSNQREHSSGGPPGTFELSAVFSVMHFSEERVLSLSNSQRKIELRKLIMPVLETGEEARPWQKI